MIVRLFNKLFLAHKNNKTPLEIQHLESDVVRMAEKLKERELQLNESQKMESIGTLAGGIAHDFNNILGSILGNAKMASNLSQNPLILDHLLQIMKAGERAKNLVQQILTFSRREKQKLLIQPVQIPIFEAISLLRATIPTRIKINTSFEKKELLVSIDTIQFQQVIMNLATNSLQALAGNSNGEIFIGVYSEKITTKSKPHVNLVEGEWAHILVKDNGKGMTQEVRKRIFEPFFTTKEAGQGTGLGLSVVHGIISTSKGFITVNSEVGKGTTFHIYLPIINEDNSSVAVIPKTIITGHGTGEKILYIDDDEVMMLMVEGLLKQAGFAPVCMNNPEDAVVLLGAGPWQFDLIVTDFNMPNMSGLEVSEFIRKYNLEIPIIISSGFLSDELIESAKTVNAVVFEKQNSYIMLCSEIAKLLATKQK